MPRRETLNNLTPNRYYQIQGTLVCKHQTQNFTTAIIEQENTQKKIKIPHSSIEIQEGTEYRFQKCFYSPNGWINVRDPTKTMAAIHSRHIQAVNLADIYTNRQSLANKYLSTYLEVLEVGAIQKIFKEGKELDLCVLKCFRDDLMVDVTLWNKEPVPPELVGKCLLFSGFRVKPLTSNALVLVSTVYSHIELDDQLPISYDPTKNYPSISCVYQNRSIKDLEEDIALNQKSLSIIEGNIKEVGVFQYQGCLHCHRKIDELGCLNCGTGSRRGLLAVAQILLEDGSGQIQVFAFEERARGVLRFARSGNRLRVRVKSTIRCSEDKIVFSHVLTTLESITF